MSNFIVKTVGAGGKALINGRTSAGTAMKISCPVCIWAGTLGLSNILIYQFDRDDDISVYLVGKAVVFIAARA